MATRVVGTGEIRYPLYQDVLLLSICLDFGAFPLNYDLYGFFVVVAIVYVFKSCLRCAVRNMMLKKRSLFSMNLFQFQYQLWQ